MLLWLVLFFSVIIVSVILAIKSMAEYQERPANFSTPFSLFLIRRPEALTKEVFDQIHRQLDKDSLMISFERLWKGDKQALVVYAPVSLIQPYLQTLGLLELEDYTQTKRGEVLAWEMASKQASLVDTVPAKKVRSAFPEFGNEEEFWWQVLLQPVGKKGKEGRFFYSVSLRAVIQARDKKRLHHLQTELLKAWSQAGLALLPQPYTTEQIKSFYKERSRPPAMLSRLFVKKQGLILEADGVKFLLFV